MALIIDVPYFRLTWSSPRASSSRLPSASSASAPAARRASDSASCTSRPGATASRLAARVRRERAAWRVVARDAASTSATWPTSQDPVSPCPPPRAGRRRATANTGTPQLSASSAASPKLSLSLGRRKTPRLGKHRREVGAAERRTNGGRAPSCSTRASTLRAPARRRSAQLARRRAAAHARRRCARRRRTRLTGRKFETWKSTGLPRRARGARSARCRRSSG